MGMEQFFTRDKANEGIKLPLFEPTGEPTDHYLIVRGVDSDEFRRSQARLNREVVKVSDLDEKEREARFGVLQTELVASLVSEWSFEDECTPESVKQFLLKAPQIQDAINVFAGRRSYFFAKRSSDSTSTPEVSST